MKDGDFFDALRRRALFHAQQMVTTLEADGYPHVVSDNLRLAANEASKIISIAFAAKGHI